MFLNIDATNGLAIYEQVVRQVVFAVASGSLKKGDMVPSVRELARNLAINPNTVSRAYRQLQDDGVLAVVRGLGLQVASGAERHCRDQRQRLIRERITAVIAEARRSGLDAETVKRLVDDALSQKHTGA